MVCKVRRGETKVLSPSFGVRVEPTKNPPRAQAFILNEYSLGFSPSATVMPYKPLLTVPDIDGDGVSSISIGPF